MSSSAPENPSPQAKPKPKRPATLGHHSSSWVNRLHRHHDKKHHATPGERVSELEQESSQEQFEDHEERPLLEGDYSHEEDLEGQPAELDEPQNSGWRSYFDSCKAKLARAFSASRDLSGRAWVTTRDTVTQNTRQVLLAIFLTILTILLLLLFGAYFRGKKEDKVTVCTSAACVHAASEILYSMDPSYSEMNIYAALDPCSDFDKVVCNGFAERHDLRPDQGDMFTGTLMAENARVTLRHILEGDVSMVPSEDRNIFNKITADYDSCMNEAAIKDNGLKPLKALIDQIKVSLPTSLTLTSERTSSQKTFLAISSDEKRVHSTQGNDQLTNTLLFLIKLDIDAFLSIGVGADDKNPETQTIFVNPMRQIGLPSKEYYDDESLLAEYRGVMTKVLEAFSDDSENSTFAIAHHNHLLRNKAYPFVPASTLLDAGNLAERILGLETKLAAATPSEEDQNDITKAYNPMTVGEIRDLLPQLSFRKLTSRLAPEGFSAGNIIVGSPAYLQTLSSVLNDTDTDTMQGYLVWKAIQRYASRIEDPAMKPLTVFNNKLEGKDPDAVESRWMTCVETAGDDLGWILSKFFVNAAFSEASKNLGDQIVSDIKDSFVTFLQKTDWMSEDVRKRAITKVRAIDQKIGYPTSNPNILDPSALEDYYKDLRISNMTFFENGIQVAQFDVRREWSKLGKPTPHDAWDMFSTTVNAYYNPAGNEIVFPAGIMQSPVFYDPSVPKYLTYGAFGAVSGHELSHGEFILFELHFNVPGVRRMFEVGAVTPAESALAFDNTGSQYDETGKYTNWWDNSTREAFENKTSCFVDQYSDFSLTGPDEKPLHINGQLTLGENVADAGGIHAAFEAWQSREKVQPSQKLPGLEKFTNEQLFFVNYGIWWCSITTKEKAIQRVYSDPHAPKPARILGTTANSEAFKKAFNCPSKKPTCELW